MPGKPWEQASGNVLRPMPAANSRPIATNGSSYAPMPGGQQIAPRRRAASGGGISAQVAGMSAGGKLKLGIALVGVPLAVLFVLLLFGFMIVQANFMGVFSGNNAAPPELPFNTDGGGIQRSFMLPNTGKIAIIVRTATPTPLPATAVPTAKPTARPTRRVAATLRTTASKSNPAQGPTPTPGVAAPAAIVRPPLPPRIWDSRLGAGGLPLLTGIGITDAVVPSGQLFWRIIKMQFQDAGAESNNNHNIYVWIEDENGLRVNDQSVQVSWDTGGTPEVQLLGIDKEHPKGDYCGNQTNCNYDWPMYGAGYRIKIAGPLPSDEAYGMIMPEHRHVNYLLTFQRVIMP